MNPYQNLQVHLTSSDRIKDKKAKYIYATAKKNFQRNRRCNTKNIRYYKNGKVRSSSSYEYQNNLSRGNILCNYCDKSTNTCGDVFVKNSHNISISNNQFSEFNGGSSITPDISFNAGVLKSIGIVQSHGLPIIESDVSGTWDPSISNWKGDISSCGPSNKIICPYGYTHNLISIPRNLDGGGITIDPSNILFSDNNCGPYKYLKSSYLKAQIIMRGSIDLSLNLTSLNPPYIPFVHKDTCNDPSYNIFINNYVQLVVDMGLLYPLLNFTDTTGVFYGIIKRICCLNKIDGIPWMDIHIEIINIGNIDMLNQILKFKPKYRGPNWRALLGPLSQAYGPFDWAPAHLPWGLFIYDETGSSMSALDIGKSVTTDGYFSDVNFYLGDCKNNLTQTNSTKTTYMSCLEDRTKKIKFT